MKKIRVLVVDNSIVYRKIITEAIFMVGGKVSVDSASTGKEALKQVATHRYQMVLLDLNIPDYDVLELLQDMVDDCAHISVVLMCRSTKANNRICQNAKEQGAFDIIIKPLDENYDDNFKIIRRRLQEVFSLFRDKYDKDEVENDNQEIVNDFKSSERFPVDLVVIAASTGGPAALEKVLVGLGDNFNKPVLVVQHMPPNFTESMANALNRKAKLEVREGIHEEHIKPGIAYIAPGGQHMLVGPKKRILLNDGILVNGVRPSADILFASVADIYRNGNILAVILTGMGRDGVDGLVELKTQCNCYCITQSEETCIVYGMPRVAVESGLCDLVLPLQEIGNRIRRICSEGTDESGAQPE